jgi:hypothetical protein
MSDRYKLFGYEITTDKKFMDVEFGITPELQVQFEVGKSIKNVALTYEVNSRNKRINRLRFLSSHHSGNKLRTQPFLELISLQQPVLP